MTVGPRQAVQPEAWLDRLLEAEQIDRQVRSLRYQFKAARFPIHRDLTGSTGLKHRSRRVQDEQLATAALMET